MELIYSEEISSLRRIFFTFLLFLTFSIFLNAQGSNPKSTQWTSAGGELVLSGNHNFTTTWASHAYSRQDGNKWWRGNFWGEREPLIPWEDAVKNSVAPVKGQIAVLGPGNVGLYQKAKGAGIYMANVETKSGFMPWVNTISFSDQVWNGTVKDYNPPGEFWGSIPADSLVTLDITAIMSDYNNQGGTGEISYKAPQDIEYEIWYFPREGGKVVEVIKECPDGTKMDITKGDKPCIEEKKEHKITFTFPPTSSKNPALPGEEIECLVQAIDELGHDLHYEWSALDSPLGFDDVHAKNPKWTVQPNNTTDVVYWPIKLKVTCDHSAKAEGQFIQKVNPFDFGPNWDLNFIEGYGVLQTIQYLRKRAQEIESRDKAIADLFNIYADRIYNAKIGVKQNPWYNEEGQASCSMFGDITLYEYLTKFYKKVFKHPKNLENSSDEEIGSVASILMHEIAHANGANEWQAHQIQRLTAKSLKVDHHVKSDFRDFFEKFPDEPGLFTPGYYNIMVKYYWIFL